MDPEMLNLAKKVKDNCETDPTFFIRNILGSKLWDKQEEIVKSVFENQHTVVKSCYGSGKSYVAARIALSFLYTHVPSKVIISSSSWTQVEKIVFAEISAAFNQAKYKLGGKLLTTTLEITKEWFIIGISPQINVGSEAYRFEGFHSPYVLVIVDQAQGINRKLWDVAKALVSNKNSRMLALGNPIEKSGPYYEACINKDGLWHCIKISAFDTPNVQTGDDVIPGLVSKNWVDNRKKDWGEEHPLYVSKVLAEFPDLADDCLIPLAWVENAREIKIPDEGEKGIGVDIARYGNDSTVIMCVNGRRIVEMKEYQGISTMETAGHIMRMMDKYKVPAQAVCIDDTGVGGGVTDRLREQGFMVTPVNNGSRADKVEQFANKVAEMYWDLRRAFETNNIDIPDDDSLSAQLVTRRFKVNSKGQIVLETKDELRKRGFKSPDKADALALAWLAKQQNKISGGPMITVIG